ncbi:MAG: LON peptidase substrate-binding domain-containing protein [Planctomycetota bacterium]
MCEAIPAVGERLWRYNAGGGEESPPPRAGVLSVMPTPHEMPSEKPEGRDENRRPVVPLFPLPGLFLVPGMALPLHIFEPRYKQMIEDLLDGPGRLVIGAVLKEDEGELAGSPPVHPIAGLGEIGRHERLEDGRFLVLLVGLMRVRIREITSDRDYRKVEIEPFEEIPPPLEEEKTLRPRLNDAIRERHEEPVKLPEDIPLGRLADLLLVQLDLPQEQMVELYSRSDVARRAEGVLAAHALRPPTNE